MRAVAASPRTSRETALLSGDFAARKQVTSTSPCVSARIWRVRADVSESAEKNDISNGTSSRTATAMTPQENIAARTITLTVEKRYSRAARPRIRAAATIFEATNRPRQASTT